METMLVFNLNPELEGDMIDYLLENDGVSRFNSFEVRGHGMYQNMSLAEQVSGRRKGIQIEVFVLKENVASIIAGLKENVGSGIYYWQQAITDAGKV